MANYFQLASRVTNILMSEVDLELNILVNGFTRNALGAKTSGIIIPFDRSLRGKYTQQYINTLQLNGLEGVAKWIELLRVFQQSGFKLHELTYPLVEALADLFHINFSSWLIPTVRLSGSLSELQVTTVYCHVQEYMTRNQMEDFSDFIKDLIEIVLYGLPMRPGIVEALGMYNPGAYLASRLFQGDFELLGDSGSLRSLTFTTRFVNEALMFKVDQEYRGEINLDDFENLLTRYKVTEEGSKRMKLQQDVEENAARILTSTHFFLGSNTESMIAIAHKFRFSGMTASYADYVKREKCGKTMGYALWEALALGNHGVTEEETADESGSVIPELWWNKVIHTSVV